MKQGDIRAAAARNQGGQVTAPSATGARTAANSTQPRGLQINSSTLANNAAANQKSQQTAQHVHHAWYHWLF
jgi:hypothetical protein